jgi:hypothetical protein
MAKANKLIEQAMAEENTQKKNDKIRDANELFKDMKMIKLVSEDDKKIMFFAARYFGEENVVAGSDALEAAWFDLENIPKLGWDEIPTIYVANKFI